MAFTVVGAGAAPAAIAAIATPVIAGAYTAYPGGITVLHSAAMATPSNPSRHR